MAVLRAPVVRRALLLGTLFWIGLRLALLLVVGVASAASGQQATGAWESHPLLIDIIVAVLAWYDLWRRNDVVFLANLGIGVHRTVAAYVAPAFLFELSAALFM